MTRFFVPVLPHPGGDPKKFQLVTSPTPQGGAAVQISEVSERLAPHAGTLASLYGADVVRMLHAEADILVALSDRAFNIAKDRVEWLRKGIEASQAKTAAAKAQAAPARTPAPAPAPAAAPPQAPASATTPAPASATTPASASAPGPASVTEVAEVGAQPAPVIPAFIAPAMRAAGMPECGIALSVPASWTESRSSKVLRFTDPLTGAKLEVSGLVRADLTLDQWQETRLNLVRHELAHLTRDGKTVALEGDAYGGRMQGLITEFTGIYPGDTAPSRYLLACIHIHGALAAIAIKAPADVFETQRPLYQLLLAGINLTVPEPPAERAPAPARARPAFDDNDSDYTVAEPRFWMARRFQVLAGGGALLALVIGLAVYAIWNQKAKAQAETAAHAQAPAIALPYVKPWSPPDDSFVVDLPRAPEELPVPPMMRERSSTFTMHQYRLFSSERIYGVQTFEYRRPTAREAILNGLEGVVVGTEGILMDKRDVTFANGSTGREVRALLPTGKVRTGRIAVINATGVVVLLTAHPGEVTDLHLAAVMNSFQPR
ncbi:MAG TPA: hypothetical protein VFS95_12415 [Telluria sp.]|nr:hypothetical protein [Telluria sp.]